MLKEKWTVNRVLTIFICCIMTVLLLFCTFIGITFSWLSTNTTKPSTGTTNLATLKGATTTSSGSYDIALELAGVIVDVNAPITNNGTMDALVRVYYNFLIDESNKQIATTSAFTSVQFNPDFVASDENIPNVYSGYYYYNKPLSAGESVDLVNFVTPTSEIANKTIKLNLNVEMVNYTGGPYMLGQELPWDNTPASWFLNGDVLNKTESVSVTPKFDIKFADVSKIQLTAKLLTQTTSNKYSMLFSRNGGAYVGADDYAGSTWRFNKLSSGTASMTPAKFFDGNYNTIEFTWDGCTATTDDYITFIWDTTWSRAISYKQIKIWDNNGQLVYDLRPNVTSTGRTPTCDGKFINVVNNTVMPMYTVSGATLTETTDTYTFSGKYVYYQDFESFADGVNSTVPADSGAKCVATTSTAKNGNVCGKVTNGLNIEDVTTDTNARLLFGISQPDVEVGVIYSVSLWVKTDAPATTMTYKVVNGELLESLPYGRFSQNGQFVIDYNYICSDEWTLVTLTTPEIVDNSKSIYFQFSIPTGTAYTTYVDDIVITKIPA